MDKVMITKKERVLETVKHRQRRQIVPISRGYGLKVVLKDEVY
jgi:hypothetical protein